MAVCVKEGRGLMRHFFQNLRGHLFEELFVAACEDRYDVMCGLYAHDQHKEKSTGETDFHGGQPIPRDSNVIPLISLCVTINFIGDCINILDRNITWRCLAYQDKMK